MKTQSSASPTVHLQQMQQLLHMEYAHEKEEFRRQTDAASLARKTRRGLCWTPVSTGRTYYNALNQFIIEIVRSADHPETDNFFEFGKPVCFFDRDADGDVRYLHATGIVSRADDAHMLVVLPGREMAASEILSAHYLGVQLDFDETSYRAMFDALSDTLGAKDNRLAQLRDTLLAARPAAWREWTPLRFPWLNETQQHAVNQVLRARDVAIVHGPPGTGKTTTLVEAIYETLRREPQALVCAPSNTAVDWIAEKLTERGLSVLRIGNPARVNDHMLDCTYERRFESHPSYPELWSIRKELRQLGGKSRRGSRDERDAIRSRINRLHDRATALEVQINADIFDSAHVVAATLVGSNQRILSGRRFGTLFIDEAAQALEAACWIAIRRADRVVLAGDHHQLPPTVKCYEAARGGLDRTLMQHVALRKPECVTMLSVQYRMNRAIMQFSSDWFYDGRLKAAPQVDNRGILDWDTPICWIDTAGKDFGEETIDDNHGRINKAEARLLMEHLRQYIDQIGHQRIRDEQIDFGIISPYKAQMRYLRQLIANDSSLRPFKAQIAVNTVDGFQGQERDVILISLVRTNDRGEIGFLSDLRRMNVAMTRARMKLIILGDSDTLGRHPFYRKLMEYVRKMKNNLNEE